MLALLLFGALIVLIFGSVGLWVDRAIERTKTKPQVQEADYHLIRALEQDIWGEAFTELPAVETPKEPQELPSALRGTVDPRLSGPTSPPPKPEDMMRGDGLTTAQRTAARKYWEAHIRGRGFGSDVRPFDQLPPDFRANLYWQADAEGFGIPKAETLIGRLAKNNKDLQAVRRTPPAMVFGKPWGSGKIAPIPGIDVLKFDMQSRMWIAHNHEFSLAIRSTTEDAAVADMAAAIRKARRKRDEESGALAAILEQSSRVYELTQRRDELVDMGEYDSARQLNVMIENAQQDRPLTADLPYPVITERPPIAKVVTEDLVKLIEDQATNYKKARAYYK